MDKKGIAEFLGVSVGTISNAMKLKDNPIPYGNVMADPRFMPLDVWEWMVRRRKK